MEFEIDNKIQKLLNKIIKDLNLQHVDSERIVCFRSYGSSSRAIARIWSLPSIWQKALKVKAHYCIEVISEKFDKLNYENQIKVLIHELLHIPKNFSGALLPHQGRGKVKINQWTVDKIFNIYKNDLLSSRR
jgi:predicted metallopeptidase